MAGNTVHKSPGGPVTDPRMWFFASLLLASLSAPYLVDRWWLPYAEWPAQWLSYHDLADRRRLLGIPNGFDVLSNLPFLFVGLQGLRLVRNARPGPHGPYLKTWERRAWGILFGGVFLTGFGSGWYHLAPDNVTLFWDRLPMAIVFMSLLTLAVGERLSLRLGARLLAPLLTLGVASVAYWEVSEMLGRGDLRPYLFVQFFPMLILPLLLLFYPSPYSHGRFYLHVFFWYALAKTLEVLDKSVYAVSEGLFSGHTLKHLAAATATFWLYRMLKKRRELQMQR